MRISRREEIRHANDKRHGDATDVTYNKNHIAVTQKIQCEVCGSCLRQGEKASVQSARD